MPLPTVYTEETLALYMHITLGNVAEALGYDVSESYFEAVNETLLDYGVDDLSNATDIRKLRALARAQAWRKAANDTAGDYDFKAGDGSYNRSQVHEQCVVNLNMALTEAAAYSDRYQVTRSKAVYIHDPYQYHEEEDREL